MCGSGQIISGITSNHDQHGERNSRNSHTHIQFYILRADKSDLRREIINPQRHNNAVRVNQKIRNRSDIEKKTAEIISLKISDKNEKRKPIAAARNKLRSDGLRIKFALIAIKSTSAFKRVRSGQIASGNFKFIGGEAILSSYGYDVASGFYEVELKFAETEFHKTSEKVFDVKINGGIMIEFSAIKVRINAKLKMENGKIITPSEKSIKKDSQDESCKSLFIR